MIRASQTSLVLLAISLAIILSSSVRADDEVEQKQNTTIVKESDSTIKGKEVVPKIGDTATKVEKNIVEEPTPKIAEAEAGQNGEKVIATKPTPKLKRRGKRKTRVKVRAPYTSVDVDTRKRHVQIRVPYYRGDIRW